MKIKLGILAGGSSPEREISLKSAAEIIKNINNEKYDALIIELPDGSSKRWIKRLMEFDPDIVFNALHGGSGENGSVAGLLNCLGIPYVGSGVLAGAMGMDKHISKALMRVNSIPVADDVFIKKSDGVVGYEEKIKEMGFPLIVKPNNGGGSIGIGLAESFDEVLNSISFVFEKMNDDALIEKFIAGREVTCVVVQNEEALDVFPVFDIFTENKFYDYNAKYIDDSAKLCFSTLPDFLQTMIKEIAKKVFFVFNCCGYCCVDFIVREEQIYVLEVNTLPGLTAHSTVTRSLAALGIDRKDFFDGLIQFRLKQREQGAF